MHLEFHEEIPLSASEIYSYLRTPADWTRLYGSFGEVEDRGDGWFAVPMRRSPFPLLTKITTDEPERRVAWEFRGFWKGSGEVTLTPSRGNTLVAGYETVAIPRMLGVGSFLEHRFLEPRFKAIWASGWRRLRRMSVSESGS